MVNDMDSCIFIFNGLVGKGSWENLAYTNRGKCPVGIQLKIIQVQ